MTMNLSYHLLLVFVIFNEHVVDVTGRAHLIVDDWRNVMFKLKKGATNIRIQNVDTAKTNGIQNVNTAKTNGWQTIFVACSGNGQSMLGAYKNKQQI